MRCGRCNIPNADVSLSGLADFVRVPSFVVLVLMIKVLPQQLSDSNIDVLFCFWLCAGGSHSLQPQTPTHGAYLGCTAQIYSPSSKLHTAADAGTGTRAGSTK